MNKWVLLSLLVALTGNCIASDDDMQDQDRVNFPLVSHIENVDVISEREGPLEEEVVVRRYAAPHDMAEQQPSCTRSFRARYFATSMLRILPSLAMATTSVILMEVVKGNSLTPNLSYHWLFSSDSYPRFFFATNNFSPDTIGNMLDKMYAFYDASSGSYQVNAHEKYAAVALNIASLYSPTFLLSVIELTKTNCWKSSGIDPYDPEDTAWTHRRRGLIKGLCIGGIGIAGALSLPVAYRFIHDIVQYNTPIIIEQLNLTSAIELCKKIPSLGIVGQSSAQQYYSYPCSTYLLTSLLVPSANGLPWSHCIQGMTSILASDYVMLLYPIFALLLNIIYLIAWL